MTRAVFGYVPSDPGGQAIKGRVFFEDAVSVDQRPWDGDLPKVLLMGPKPTSYQAYLRDASARDATHDRELVNWSSRSCALRGYKRYWHRPNDVVEGELRKTAAAARDLQDHLRTTIRPVRAGARFRGRIRFENLTEAEFGALYACIRLPAGLAHKIGMGKNLGLGSVNVRVLKTTLFDQSKRYRSLSANDGITTAPDTQLQRCYWEFVAYVAPGKPTLWRGRLLQLAALLSWENQPDKNDTRQVPISNERENQWKKRYELLPPKAYLPDGVEPHVEDVFPRAVAATTPSPNAAPASEIPAYKKGSKVTGTVRSIESGLATVEVGNQILTKVEVFVAQPGQCLRFVIADLNEDGSIKKMKRG
jgi:hypothetical protein